jgi:hypothetical protein
MIICLFVVYSVLIIAYFSVKNIYNSYQLTIVSQALSIPIIVAYPFMTHLSGIRLGVPLYIAAMLKSLFAVSTLLL